MVKEGQTPVPTETRDRVHAFLAEHQGKFEIGLQPVQRYIARHRLQVPSDVSKELTRIQRVYQITPSDGAMNALLERGVDSALAVSRYDREHFVRQYKDALGGAVIARLTHAKAQQVHNIVLNLASTYLVARTTPQIGVHSPAKFANETPGPIAVAIESVAKKEAASVEDALHAQAAASPENAADIIPYATLEALFGSMDFCTCEHCHSVLSPAAYLVDLLQFLDRDEDVWGQWLKDWQTDHGAPYPFADQAAWIATGMPQNTKITPLQVLLSRRPDIEYLPLTCENTNTPLPYIDLVNETLEYYVAHNLSLAGYEGHSTDDTITPEELLASPQSVQDQDVAYETLAGKPGEAPPLLPPTAPLPFHQPLESLRRYFDTFERPLPEVMEALRTHDEIERPAPANPDNPVEYGWRDILMEELRLSRAEYRLLTVGQLSIQQLYGYDPSEPEQDVLYGREAELPDKPARPGLSNARAFAQRMCISYEEIVDILKTRFVNPGSTLIPKLEELGVTFANLKALKETPLTGQAWLDLLPNPKLDPSHFGGDIESWVTDEANYARIMKLIALTVTSVEENSSSFEMLELRYAEPDKNANQLRRFEFVRLLRFIRLWKKLGWTIEQTDKAIAALYPESQNPDSADDQVNVQRLDEGFLTMLPRLGEVKRLMRLLRLTPKRDLLPLLACFAPIDTHGAASLYRQLFLYPAPSEDDSPFLDDGFGNYLTKPEKLSAHVEALRAAFLLTDDEIRLIIGDLVTNADPPVAEPALSLDTISTIYRHGWLARKLKLSVREFLLLVKMTGLNPFASLDLAEPPIDPAEPRIIRLIGLANRLRAASLRPQQALYLIWNQDISGKSAPPGAEVLQFARQLRDAFAAIDGEFAPVDDPNGQIARARMALVYGNDATSFFFSLLDNSLRSEVPYDHDQDSEDDLRHLSQSILDAAAGRAAYDDFGKRLSFSGVMSEAASDALKGASTSVKFKEAVHNSFEPYKANLYAENQKVVEPFFARYPELRPLYELYAFFGEVKTQVSYSHKDETLAKPILEAGAGRLAYDHTLKSLSLRESRATTFISISRTSQRARRRSRPPSIISTTRISWLSTTSSRSYRAVIPSSSSTRATIWKPMIRRLRVAHFFWRPSFPS
jgi:hypothetical protein